MGAHDQSQTRGAVSKWQSALLLGLLFVTLCCFSVFGIPIDSDQDANEFWYDFHPTAYMGVTLAEPTLLAVLMALAGSSPKVRITVGLGAMLFLAVTTAIGHFRFGNYLGSANSLLVPLGLQLIVTFFLLCGLRRWTSWRIQRTSADAFPNEMCDQFSIWWLMVWTTQVALFGGLLNYLQLHHPGIELVRSSTGSVEHVAGEVKEPIGEILWLALSLCLVGLPAVPGAWMILGRPRAMAIGALVTLPALVGTAGFSYLFWFRVPEQSLFSFDDWTPIIGVVTGVGLGSSLVYFVLRAAGYRLIRVSNATVGPAEKDARQVVVLPVWGRASLHCQLQFAVALVVLLTTCFVMGGTVLEFVQQQVVEAQQQRWARFGFDIEVAMVLDPNEKNHATWSLSLEDGRTLSEPQLKGIESLGEMPPLSLSGNTTSGPQLEMLSKLTHLSSINLADSGTLDEHLALVGKMTQLKSLILSNINAKGSSFAALANLKNLETLDLSKTQIADEALVHLHGLKSLKHLDLSSTAVTAAGVEKLREALPEAIVSWQ